MSEINSQFASKAKEWAKANVPYQHRGTTRAGCDCTGLLIGIAQELGFLKNYKLRIYPPDWNLHAGAGNQVIEELEKFAEFVPKHKSKAGDIAVIHFGKCPAHCGVIVADNLLMVHALSTNKKVTFAILKNSMWAHRWKKTYRPSETKLKNYD